MRPTTSALRRTAAAAAIATAAIATPVQAAQATPAPHQQHAAVPAATTSPSPIASSTAVTSKGTGGDRTMGFVLGGIMLATMAGMMAYFLKGRRKRM